MKWRRTSKKQIGGVYLIQSRTYQMGRDGYTYELLKAIAFGFNFNTKRYNFSIKLSLTIKPSLSVYLSVCGAI